ncbi:hypothetical protein BaRGS_00024958 [Batillaria attramentaria]|uniref:Glutathione peroxidase n=1 Tax=Batillaria attramentaria TaxID=370345 RepID=A0ABD0K9J6_9CAEN
MNALQTKYGDQGLTVLGFPCNQFHYQEPGTEAEILNGVKYVRPGGGFVPNFQMFAKIDVNGPTEAPLYTYLKSYCLATTTTFTPSVLMYTPIKSSDVMWNWETFLVNKTGKVIARAPPALDPMAWEPKIQQELGLNPGGAAVGK